MSEEEEIITEPPFCDLEYHKTLSITLIIIVVILIALVIVITILGLCGVFNPSKTKSVAFGDVKLEKDQSDSSSLMTISQQTSQCVHKHKIITIPSGPGIYMSNKVLFDLNRQIVATSAEYNSMEETQDFFFHVAFMLTNVEKSTVLFTNSYQNLGQIILNVQDKALTVGIHGNTDHILKTNQVLEPNISYFVQIVFSVNDNVKHLELIVCDRNSNELSKVDHPLPLGFEFSKDVFPMYVGGRIFEGKYYDCLEQKDVIYFITFSEESQIKWTFTAVSYTSDENVELPLRFTCSNPNLDLVWKPYIEPTS